MNITLDGAGGAAMNRVTRDNIGRRLGVLFVERKTRTSYEVGPDGTEREVLNPYYVKRIISLATVRDALGVELAPQIEVW